VTQLTLESVIVGLVGGALGVWLASMGLRLFAAWTAELPRGSAVDLDARVLGVAIALSTATALVFGLFPALRSIGTDVQTRLRAGGTGATGSRSVNALRNGMVIAEVALSLVLVTTAGLLMRSFAAVTAQDTGLDAEGVYMVPLNLSGIESAEDYRLRMEEIVRSVRDVAGVQSATYGIEAPFEFVGGDRCCMSSSWSADGDADGTTVSVLSHVYGSDFLETFGTELVAGRSWTPGEVGAAPVPSVISEGLAIRAFGSAEAAVGRELDLRGGLRVVGVVEPTLHYGLDQAHDLATYSPMEMLGFPIGRATVAVRTQGGDGALGGSIREAIWAVEGDLPVPTVTALSTWIDRSTSARRLGGTLFGAFGTIALVLAAAGLYGTLVYAVGQRRRELGIRIALGAGRQRVQGEVLRRGVGLAIVGVIIGGAVAWFTTRLLESFLFGVAPGDPVAFAGSAALLLAAAVVAAWVPAWRAGRTDPLETLKAE
jgi:predicted permease